ncbi:MAG TPA: sulfurtransferase-like selenium metabolism protein YedF [Bacteroidales bacterium]|nr:sulfurtransferase-like selenium metabolism protein YedF [Bacteroidales bacterium]
MIEIDAKGLICPQPLMLAKQALDEAIVGESICIVTDSETSMQNLMRFLADLKANPVCEQTAGSFSILATKSEESSIMKDIPCSTGNNRSLVIAITSDVMGNGSEELGKILMKAFINTIVEMEQQPTHIIFYNSGVWLAHNNSDVLASLKQLEDSGVYILVCGTCANYFEISAHIGVGQISNMYTIADTLSKAALIIRP